uniref:Uncharacterized protein n=1 Tax=Rhizophora mucronata TaxID=61149 RepID=A0A2P2LP53_RHIMU
MVVSFTSLNKCSTPVERQQSSNHQVNICIFFKMQSGKKQEIEKVDRICVFHLMASTYQFPQLHEQLFLKAHEQIPSGSFEWHSL